MQLVVYILIYPLLWFISILPYRLFYGLSDFFFFWVYIVFGYRKKVVRGNLELVFPEKSTAELRKIEKEFYGHLCDLFMEMVKTMNLSKEEISKRFNVVNKKFIQDLEKEKSILVVCPHYANWEWNLSISNFLNSKGYGVYQKIGNIYFDRLIKRIRSKWNTHPLIQKDTVRTVVSNEKDNIRAIYGMVSDQSPPYSRAQYWSNFMGQKVPIHNGAETLARKLDLAVVYLKVTKKKRGYYKAEFIPITLSGKETEKNEITNQFLRLVEEHIKEAPQYYLWTHRRWKHLGKTPKHNK